MSRTEFSANFLEKRVSFSYKILKQRNSGKSNQLLLRKMLNWPIEVVKQQWFHEVLSLQVSNIHKKTDDILNMFSEHVAHSSFGSTLGVPIYARQIQIDFSFT